MFGKNPVRNQDLSTDGSLYVQEIFPTLQGEGPYAGQSALFVRLWGCNLRCWFCDTDFESNAKRYSVGELFAALNEKRKQVPHSDLIVLTGGEPLRQNVVPFIREAARVGYYIQIETAGTLWVDGLEHYIREGIVDLVCSPKTPKVHSLIERHCKHYKYIVDYRGLRDPSDGLPLATTQKRIDATRDLGRPGDSLTIAVQKLYRPKNAVTIWVQPCEEYRFTGIEQVEEIASKTPELAPLLSDADMNAANRKLCAALAMKHGYRLSLQQHKILGLP